MFTTLDYEKLQLLMDERPENKALIQKLLDSQQFTVSMISHEIRNPLTLIYSTLQLIEAQHPEVNAYSHWSQVIMDVEFVVQLLDELSTYNNPHLKIQELNFYTFMKHLTVSFATSLIDTDIEFTSTISPTLPLITGDKTKLREVFLNLLKNAKEAIAPDGKITLTTAISDFHIIIVITDNGCGIPSDQLDTIYTPFITHKSGGTGLGLPICQKVVTAHGGTIQVQSLVGNGTTFTISLPIQCDSQEKSTE